jgi:hypothetical protein
VGPTWFQDFSIIQKSVQTIKFKTDTFHCSKNTQTLHDARSGPTLQNFLLFVDHPLGPATDDRLGKLLPHQQAN